MQRTTDRKFKTLLGKKGRIDKNIDALITLFREKPFKKPFISRLKKSISVLPALKFMMVLHNLIYEGLIDSTTCDGYLKQIVFKMQGTAQRYMVDHFLNPYKLYLQKRNGVSIDPDKSEQCEVEIQLFKLINQVKLVGTFQQIIYTFGRYYPQYEFIIDFNIIVAKDIKKIYAKIKELSEIHHKSFTMMQIQFLHEVMYPIFYNNYYYRQVYSFRPKWVLTDDISLTPTKKYIKKVDSTASGTIQANQNPSQHQQRVSQFNILQDSQQLTKPFDLNPPSLIDKQLISQFALFDLQDIQQDLSCQQDQPSITTQASSQ